MPRMARVVAAGVPHHITQRGNHRQQVFFLDRDYRRYIELLRASASRAGVRILGYCLMPNHVHLVAAPNEHDSFARCLRRVHLLYAQHWNQLQNTTGHVWQNRYFSAPLDLRHLTVALRYVDCNPVRAGLIKRAEDYAWSSARAHVLRRDPRGLLDMDLWGEVCPTDEWREILQTPAEPQAEINLRNSTLTGRPCGGSEFVEELQRLTGRNLRLRSGGRPKGWDSGGG